MDTGCYGWWISVKTLSFNEQVTFLDSTEELQQMDIPTCRFEICHNTGLGARCEIQGLYFLDALLTPAHNFPPWSWRNATDGHFRFHLTYDTRPVVSNVTWTGGCVVYMKHRLFTCSVKYNTCNPRIPTQPHTYTHNTVITNAVISKWHIGSLGRGCL